MKIYPKFVTLTAVIVTVFIALMITNNNSEAAMEVPDNFNGVTYRNNFTIRYPNIEVLGKNLDTELEWSTTSNGNSDYTLPVNARQGDDFYLKAWKASDPSQFDEDNVYHPGSHSGVTHDFSLSPPA